MSLGNMEKELLSMCADLQFDVVKATELAKLIELNQEFPDPGYPSLRTSFLAVARFHANIEMVRILLQCGADPNFILYADEPLHRETPFWDLQYNDYGETEAENEVGLQMAQLMLDYGADPNIVLDDDVLFSYVCSAIFNDNDEIGLLRYRSRFFILLVAYGGRSEYCQPDILKPFDKSNMAQYQFRFVPCGDGYHLTGEIVDGNFEVVAKI